MSRMFGKVISSLWGSPKFRALANDTHRLAYHYVLTNQHGNAIGAYRLPLAYIGADMDHPEPVVREAMHDLCSAGLVDYDASAGVVRVLSWYEHNPITNAKHFIGAVSAFALLPSSATFLTEIAADLLLDAHRVGRNLQDQGTKHSRSDNPKTRSFGAKNQESAASIFEAMQVLVDKVSKKNGDLSEVLIRRNDRVSIELSKDLMIDLSIHKTETETETKTETETGAMGSIQAEIRALSAKAKAAK